MRKVDDFVEFLHCLWLAMGCLFGRCGGLSVL